MKTKKLIPPLVISTFSLITQISNAANITINLEGKGEVIAQEASINCAENCVITNDLSKNTLIASPSSGWVFSGWTDQKCDSGSGALMSKENIFISGAFGGAKTIVTGDLNNDNIDDLVTISLFNGLVIAQLNEGNDTYTKKTISTKFNYPTALDLYDWDGDSDLDLFVAEYGNGIIKVYLNDGNGIFTFDRDLTFNNKSPYSFAVEDKNNDGLPDILISSFSSNISGDLYVLVNSISSAVTQWYINSGEQLHAEEKISENAAMTIDLYKSNNEISILSAEIKNGEVALYQSGKRTVIDTGKATYGAAFGDIDNDGLIDVLAAHYKPSKLNLLYGISKDSFSAAHLITAPEEGVTATSFGDYNQDGYLDIATSEFNKKKFYYFPTISYKDCIISSGTDISLTATFIPSTDGSIKDDLVEEKNSSGGNSFYILFLLSYFIFRRKVN